MSLLCVMWSQEFIFVLLVFSTHVFMRLLSVSGNIRGVHGSGLCPTQTRPEWGGWMKNWPETDPEIWSNFSVWVSSVLGWFGLVSGFIIGVEIWPDLARSGRNLFGAVEIRPKSGQIHQDLPKISLDNGEISLDLDQISPKMVGKS